jgi:Tripartite tricarboxylate transporter family receptor
VPADTFEHERLDVRCRDAGDAACLIVSLLQESVGDIVPVTHPLLVRVRRAHAVAAVIEDAARQNGGRALEPNLPFDGVGGELGLHGFEQVTVEDRLVFPAMQLAPIGDLADIEPAPALSRAWRGRAATPPVLPRSNTARAGDPLWLARTMVVTTPEIINKLNKEINAGLADPKLKARLAELGGTVFPGSPADFGKLIAEDTEKWAKVVKFAGIKAD